MSWICYRQGTAISKLLACVRPRHEKKHASPPVGHPSNLPPGLANYLGETLVCMGIGSWTEPETRWSAEAFEALLDWHKESKPKEAALQISPKYNWLPIFATTSRKISPNSLILGGPGNCETFPSTPHSERVGYMRKVLHLSLLINYNNVLIHWPCGDFILFSTTDRSEARVGYNTAGGGLFGE